MGRKKQIKTIDWAIKKYMDFFQEFGMNEGNIRRYYAEWKVKHTESIEDFIWHIFNHLLHENASQSQDITGFLKRNRDIYLQMHNFRRVIEGKKAHEILQLLNKTKLELTYEQSNLEMDAFVVGAPDCTAFLTIQGKKFPIRDLFKKEVIPYDTCTRERGCVCGYAYEGRIDSQGSLIRKK